MHTKQANKYVDDDKQAIFDAPIMKACKQNEQ